MLALPKGSVKLPDPISTCGDVSRDMLNHNVDGFMDYGEQQRAVAINLQCYITHLWYGYEPFLPLFQLRHQSIPLVKLKDVHFVGDSMAHGEHVWTNCVMTKSIHMDLSFCKYGPLLSLYQLGYQSILQVKLKDLHGILDWFASASFGDDKQLLMLWIALATNDYSGPMNDLHCLIDCSAIGGPSKVLLGTFLDHGEGATEPVIGSTWPIVSSSEPVINNGLILHSSQHDLIISHHLDTMNIRCIHPYKTMSSNANHGGKCSMCCSIVQVQHMS